MSEVVGAQTSAFEFYLNLGGAGRHVGLAMVIAAWVAGLVGLSWSSSLIIAFLAYAYWFQQTRRMRRGITWGIHKAMRDPRIARAVMGIDLPSWINLSPIERSLWLQSLIDNIWPYVSGPTEASLAHGLTPLLEKYRPKALLSVLELGYFDLGDIPPRIEGVQVSEEGGGGRGHGLGLSSASTSGGYHTNDGGGGGEGERSRATTTIIDLNVVWAGNPDIRLLAAMGAAEVEASLSNLQFRALVRLTLGPYRDEWPCFSAISISFVGKPQIEYALRAARLPLDAIPGFASWLNGFVVTMAGMLVYPRRLVFPIPSSSSSRESGTDYDAVAAAQRPDLIVEPVGCLFVEIRRALNLPSGGSFGVAGPAYVQVTSSMGDDRRSVTYRTKSVKGSSPNYEAAHKEDYVYGKQHRKERNGPGTTSSSSSDRSSSVTLSSSSSSRSSSTASTTTSIRTDTSNSSGEAKRKNKKKNKSENKIKDKSKKSKAQKSKNAAKAAASAMLAFGRGLAGGVGGGVKGMNTALRWLSFRPKSSNALSTNFMQFPLYNVPGEEITMEVVRSRSVGNRIINQLFPQELGKATIGKVGLPTGTLMVDRYDSFSRLLAPNAGGSTRGGPRIVAARAGSGGSSVLQRSRVSEDLGTLVFTTYYRPFASDVRSIIERDVSLIGLLLVDVVKAERLIPADFNGLSDPYVVVRVGRREAKTECVLNTLNPNFNNTVLSLNLDARELDDMSEVELLVFDKDSFGVDALLGQASVALESILRTPTCHIPSRAYRLTRDTNQQKEEEERGSNTNSMAKGKAGTGRSGSGGVPRRSSSSSSSADPHSSRRGALTVGLKLKLFSVDE